MMAVLYVVGIASLIVLLAPYLLDRAVAQEGSR